MKTPELWVLAYDLHYPVHNRPAWLALCDFLRQNRVDGFLWGGDQLDMQEVSHWTKGKGMYRGRGALAANLKGFAREILDPLDKLLPKRAKRIWLTGNHERFLTMDLIEEQPELEGMLSLDDALGLKERGYQIVGLGGHYQLGDLFAIHGDSIGGGANPAKKAVDTWSQNIVMGHSHTLQAYTKASPAHETKRWTGTVLPCLSETNPGYGRGRPNTWLTGFGIAEVRQNGDFNLYPAVITDGQFSYAGRIYGKPALAA